MAKYDNFLGKNVQYFMMDCSTQSTSNLINTLGQVQSQLPKNSVLFCELEDNYQMYITNNDGNCKPITSNNSPMEILDIEENIDEIRNTLQQYNTDLSELQYNLNSHYPLIVQNQTDISYLQNSAYNLISNLSNNYYTNYECDNLFVTKVYANDEYFTKTEISQRYKTPTELSSYYFYTQTESDHKYLQLSQAEQYALKSDYYTKSDINSKFLTTSMANSKFLTKIDAEDKYLTKTQANRDYYTKTQSDNTFLTQEQTDIRYFTQQQIIENYYTKSDIERNYYTKENIDNNFINSQQIKKLQFTTSGSPISLVGENNIQFKTIGGNSLLSSNTSNDIKFKTINGQSLLGEGNIVIESNGESQTTPVVNPTTPTNIELPTLNRQIDGTGNAITSIDVDDHQIFVHKDTIFATKAELTAANNSLNNKSDKNQTINEITLSLSDNNKLILNGKYANQQNITPSNIELPFNQFITNASFDNDNKLIKFTRWNNETPFNVDISDFANEFQEKITDNNKLSADLIVDGTINKIVTLEEKNTWNNKQNKITEINTISADCISEGSINKIVTQTEKNTWNDKQNKITETNKISADCISDGNINKVVTSNEKNYWNSQIQSLLQFILPVTSVSAENYYALATDVLIVVTYNATANVYLPEPNTVPVGKFYIIKHKNNRPTYVRTYNWSKRIMDDDTTSMEDKRNIEDNICIFFNDGTDWLSLEEND